MPVFTLPFFESLPHLNARAILDIALVAFLIYHALMIVRGRRAAHILTGAAILLTIYLASIVLHLQLIRAILQGAAPYAPFALIVMFQSEIRRVLARIGRRRLWPLGKKLERREAADELVLALTQLSQHHTGALVVIERDIGLRTFIESGVLIDGLLSRDLMLTIFMNGGALHDGAAVVQGTRIAAAACFLPLSTRPSLARSLGTRHRAAIGVTEETDCLALIVSEETGAISVAAFGDLERNVSSERLRERVIEHMVERRWTHVPRSRQGDADDHAMELRES